MGYKMDTTSKIQKIKDKLSSKASIIDIDTFKDMMVQCFNDEYKLYLRRGNIFKPNGIVQVDRIPKLTL